MVAPFLLIILFGNSSVYSKTQLSYFARLIPIYHPIVQQNRRILPNRRNLIFTIRQSFVPCFKKPKDKSTMERRSKATLEMISQKLNAWELRKEYLQTGITIIKMAKALGINRTYLSNFINDTYAMNFNNWLNGLRIEEAKKRMLTDRRLPMSTLAAMVGFTDLAHFSKQFKLKEGIAPTYWLQKQPKLKPVSGN